MNKDFYITLASNSNLDYYPNNTVSNFTVKLPQNIVLTNKYEVALVEANIPNTWYDIDNESYFSIYKLYKNSDNDVDFNRYFLKTVYVKPSNYDKIDAFVQILNDESYKKYLTVFVQENKIIIRLRKKIEIRFSNILKHKLGFENNIIFNITESDLDIERGNINLDENNLTSFFIYCNLIEPQIVSDKCAPLLRIINFNKFREEKTVIKEFANPFYVPVLYKNFWDIEINIRDIYGKLIKFTSTNPSLFILHFKAK